MKIQVYSVFSCMCVDVCELWHTFRRQRTTLGPPIPRSLTQGPLLLVAVCSGLPGSQALEFSCLHFPSCHRDVVQLSVGSGDQNSGHGAYTAGTCLTEPSPSSSLF